MPIALSDSLYKKINDGAVDASSAFLSGETTTVFSTAAAGGATVAAGAGAAQLATEVGPQLVAQVVASVTTNAAAKVGQALGEVLAPPSIADISAKAASAINNYVMSAGDLMKELLADSEDNQDNAQLDNMKKSCDETYSEISAKAANMKKKVDELLGPVEEQCQKITAYIIQGPEWVTRKLNWIEEEANKNVNEFIDTQKQQILDKKNGFIESQAEGLAQRKAEIINQETRKKLKKQIDEIKILKEKAIIKAKALVGKALLNLMATLGL